MKKIYILDDIQEHLDELKTILDKEKDFEFSYFNSINNFLYELEDTSEQVSACIIDIQLWDKNGIDFSSEIIEKFPNVKIIFMTAYNDKYSQAIFLHPSEKLKPFALITKPFDEKVIAMVLDKLRYNKTQYIIHIRQNDTVILYERVTYIENKARKVMIYTVDGNVFGEYRKINEILDKFPASFCQCHKSFVVNMDKINSINRTEKTINIGETVIPISRRYSNEFFDRFLKYKGGISND